MKSTFAINDDDLAVQLRKLKMANAQKEAEIQKIKATDP